jgi:uncharacterized membrane protein
MQTTSKLIGAAAISLFFAPPLWAQPAKPAPIVARPAIAATRRIVASLGNAGPSPFVILLRSARLSPAQQNQVRQILHAEAMKNRPLFQRLQATREQISDELLGAGTVTAGDLAPLEQQAVRIRAQIDHNLIESSLAIRGLLTPDQVSHLAEVHRRLESLRAQVVNLLAPQ